MRHVLPGCAWAPALFNTFPSLQSSLPWLPLAAGPTPVEWANLRGCPSAILVKRDDLADERYGGNKVRKFEFILGDLKARGFSALWTTGGLCSNHCTAAAIYGQAAGVPVRLYYLPTPLEEEELDLLKVQAYLGAVQRMLPGAFSDWLRLLAGALDFALTHRDQNLNPEDQISNTHRRRAVVGMRGRGPYFAPPGGSSTAGIFGYVNAGLELSAQVHSGEAACPDVIYVAGASHGTALGLCMGFGLGGLSTEVIVVETVTRSWQRSRVLLPTPLRAYRQLARRLPGVTMPSFESLQPTVDRRYEGLAVGETCPELKEAALRGQEELGIQLDPHYSVKAFAAMLQDLSEGRHKGKRALFWHTHGRLPSQLLQASRESGTRLPPAVAQAAERSLRR